MNRAAKLSLSLYATLAAWALLASAPSLDRLLGSASVRVHPDPSVASADRQGDDVDGGASGSVNASSILSLLLIPLVAILAQCTRRHIIHRDISLFGYRKLERKKNKETQRLTAEGERSEKEKKKEKNAEELEKDRAANDRKRLRGTKRRDSGADFFFLALCTTIAWAHGLHAGCVTITSNLNSKLDGSGTDTDTGPSSMLLAFIYAFIDYLHEFVSHNIFQVAFFTLLLFLAWEEANSCEKDDIQCEISEEDEESPEELEGDSHGLAVLLEWAPPLLFGAFFTVFALRTATLAVTLCFYASATILHFFLAPSRAPEAAGIKDPRRAQPAGLIVKSALTKIAVAGMLSLAALGLKSYLLINC